MKSGVDMAVRSDGSVGVKLSEADIALGTDVGLRRYKMNVAAGRGDFGLFQGFPGDPPERQHIEGALCELVVSRAFDRPWDGMIFDEPLWQAWRRLGHDVGPFEIRGTPHPRGRLVVRDRDPDDAPFILVRSANKPVYVVMGWCLGREAKNERYLDDPGDRGVPAYFVPIDALKPIASLQANFESARAAAPKDTSAKL